MIALPPAATPTMATLPPRPIPRAPPVLRVGFAGSIGRCCFSDLLLRADAGLEPAFSTASRKGLLAALAAGELDAAVYPGPPAPGLPSALLCHDRLVVAAASGHPLAASAPVPVEALARHPVLLPAENDGGEFRRLVRALLPALAPGEDAGPRELARWLELGDATALVSAGQADELGTGALILPLADPRAEFPVRIGWTPAAARSAFRRLLPELDV